MTEQLSGVEHVLRPKSVAIVGASERSYHGMNLYQGLKKGGFEGSIYLVNHKRREVFGERCYNSLLEIPAEIDLAAIAVPREAVISVVEQAAKHGVKGVLVVTAGFAEADMRGRELQKELLRIARKRNLRICGPNGMGFLNLNDRVFLTSGVVSDSLRAGNVGVVSQSGVIYWGIASNSRRLGFSYLISVGNGADLSVWDYVDYLIADPGTDVISVYLETIHPADRFLDVAAKALEARKPIVVLRVGTSSKGREAAASHTGGMASSTVVVEAAFRQNKIIRVRDLDELLETSKLLSHVASYPSLGEKVAFVTLSGGESGHIADLAADVGLQLATLSKQTRATVADLLPRWRKIANPLDVGGGGMDNARVFGGALKSVLQDGGVDLVFGCRNLPPTRRSALTRQVLEAAGEVASTSSKPCGFFTTISGEVDWEVAEPLLRGTPLLQGARATLLAIKHCTEYFGQGERVEGRLGARVHSVVPRVDEARRILQEGDGVLDEKRTKDLLQLFGIPVVKEAIVHSEAEALALALEWGYPLVLKPLSAKLVHKSDFDLVWLDLRSDVELKRAYRQLIQHTRLHLGSEDLEGVLVQRMIQGGTEIILGLKRDETFGLTILLGIGGVLTEVVGDFSLRLVPIDLSDADAMIRELRGYKALQGARGRAPVDFNALRRALLGLSALGYSLSDEIEALDINPLILLSQGEGAFAVDALTVRRQQGAEKGASVNEGSLQLPGRDLLGEKL